jgi:hypothetical protein
MVWIKSTDNMIVNLENVLSIRWTYRSEPTNPQHTPIGNSNKVILEIYVKVKHVEEEILIYNKKIYEDVEKLGSVRYKEIVRDYKEDLSVPKILPSDPDNIVKNTIAMDFVNKILSRIAEAKEEEIINFYNVFRTRKES